MLVPSFEAQGGVYMWQCREKEFQVEGNMSQDTEAGKHRYVLNRKERLCSFQLCRTKDS